MQRRLNKRPPGNGERASQLHILRARHAMPEAERSTRPGASPPPPPLQPLSAIHSPILSTSPATAGRLMDGYRTATGMPSGHLSLTPRFSGVYCAAALYNRFSGFERAGKPLKRFWRHAADSHPAEAGC